MSDLLNQAIDRLDPKGRAQCNAALAYIQNCRNVEHDHFLAFPDTDAWLALRRMAREERTQAAFYWDNEWTVKGLS